MSKFLENTLVILLWTPENFFKAFLIILTFTPKFIQTAIAAVALRTLCFPISFKLMFLKESLWKFVLSILSLSGSIDSTTESLSAESIVIFSAKKVVCVWSFSISSGFKLGSDFS